MKLRRIGTRILLPSIGATVLFSIVLYFSSNGIVRGLVERNLEQISQSKVADIYAGEGRIADTMLSHASLFSEAEAVQQAYATAYQGNLNDANDMKMDMARDQLRAFFSSIEKGYAKAHGQKPFRIHFHVPPARSLLRLWKKDQNQSDDLSSFRNTIKTISSGSHLPIKGIEIGRGGFSLRGVAPIFAADGKYMGSVECLSTYDPLVKYSVSNKNEFIAVYMNKEFLPIATKLQDASINPILGDKFVFVSSTERAVTDAVITPELLDLGKSGKTHAKIDGYFTTAFPINDYSGKQIGVMAYLYDADHLYSTLDKVQWGIAVICIILLAAIIIPLYVATRSVTRPIKRMVKMLQDIAKGEGDLTRRLPENTNTELGDLARAFNQFIEKLHRIIKALSGDVDTLATSSVDLSAASEKMSMAAENTYGNSNLVAAASEKMSANMNSVAAASEQASTNVNIVAAATEEMTATINEIAQNSARARNFTSHAVDQSRSASNKVNELGKAASEISKVTEVITEISEQTNLLALNATIEAARAGKSGKGFAVVANEIKELARQTAAATHEIKRQIEGVQSSTNDTVDEIGQISEVIDEVNTIVTAIAAAVEEQSVATKEIANNVSQASQGIQDVNVNIAQSTTVAEEISRDINGVNNLADDIAASSSQVNISAMDLHKLSDKLKTIVDTFKISGPKFDIGSVKKAHLLWRSRLEALLHGRQALSLEMIANHHECDFGKWYDSLERQAMQDIPAFADTGMHHENVHLYAHRIVESYHRGDSQQTGQLMKTFEAEREELFAALDELYLS